MRIELKTPPRRGLALTALVDVMFNVLFFFMLASSYVAWQQFTLNLAGSPVAAPLAEPGPAWALRVLPGGSLELNAVPLPPEQIEARLRAAPAGTRVVLQPAPGVPVQLLVDVLDRFRGAAPALLLGRAAP
ncbi:MAG TPA: biopolymer transporter ExbD [Solimonas sp.]|nr:biopolymer transporter ExbD [Solimonas sp.]